MKRHHWSLIAAVLVAASCAPPPTTQTLSTAIVHDQEVYPDGNSFRLLGVSELPIVAVTADSEAPGFARTRLADGDLATQWSSGVYRATTAWAAVELAATADLSSVSIKTGVSKAGTSFDIQVSQDGVNWATALANQTNTTWGLETKSFPTSIRGRFVRVVWQNSPAAPDARFSIFEMVVNGEPTVEPSPTPPATESPLVSPTPAPEESITPPPVEGTPSPAPSDLPPSVEPTTTPPVDVTPTPGGEPGPLVRLQPTQATGSSSYSSLSPSRAVDGDPTTQWGSDGYRSAEEWLALAFDAPAVFEQIRIKTGALPAGVTYKVEASDDGISWRPSSDALGNSTWNLETKTIAGQGRFLRVRFSNNPSAPMSRFYVFELEVLGRVLGPTPASPSPVGESPTPPPESPTPDPGSPTVSPTPTQAPSVEPSATSTPPPATPGPAAPLPHRRLSTPGSAIASSGTAGMAVDGLPGTSWSPSSSGTQFIAVPLADHPGEPSLLVMWDSAGYHYTNVNAAPRTYEIHTSNNSTDGRDGTWTVAKRAVDNPTRSRIDAITAPGARWVRVVVQSVWSYGPQLRELTVYGCAASSRFNAWLIMGDSITAQSFDPGRSNQFAGLVEARIQGYRPLLVAGGTGGDTAELGRQKLSQGLAMCPPGSFVGLAFGTNDATRGVPIATFKYHMQQMVSAIMSSGRTPMIARTSWSLNGNIPQYVRAVNEIVAANSLAPGPDLFSHFKAHPEQLREDKVHPTAEGEQAIQRLWAEAVSNAYLR
jgi:lysophospholipase L1-like esterase